MGDEAVPIAFRQTEGLGTRSAQPTHRNLQDEYLSGEDRDFIAIEAYGLDVHYGLGAPAGGINYKLRIDSLKETLISAGKRKVVQSLASRIADRY